jgi:hypothetical protein
VPRGLPVDRVRLRLEVNSARTETYWLLILVSESNIVVIIAFCLFSGHPKSEYSLDAQKGQKAMSATILDSDTNINSKSSQATG